MIRILQQDNKATKIIFAEMRDMGVRGLLVYCAVYRCSHSIAISGAIDPPLLSAY